MHACTPGGRCCPRCAGLGEIMVDRLPLARAIETGARDVARPGVRRALEQVARFDRTGRTLALVLQRDVMSRAPKLLPGLRALLLASYPPRTGGLGQVPTEATMAIAAGAAVGSAVFPGIGTVVGTLAGALMQIFGGGASCASPPCYPRPGGDGYYSCSQSHDLANVADIASGNMAAGSFLIRILIAGYYPGADHGLYGVKPIEAAPFPDAQFPQPDEDQRRANTIYFIYRQNTKGYPESSSGPCPNYAAPAAAWLKTNIPILARKYGMLKEEAVPSQMGVLGGWPSILLVGAGLGGLIIAMATARRVARDAYRPRRRR